MKKLNRGNYLFKVPNNEEGRAIIKLLRKSLNSPNYKIRIRGRKQDKTNPDYKPRRTEIPLSIATELAVYLQGKDGEGYQSMGIYTFKSLEHYKKLYRTNQEKLGLMKWDEKDKFINFCVDNHPEFVLKYKMYKANHI